MTTTHLPPVVCAIDDHYLLPLLALMRSLVLSHVDDHADLRLIVLHHGLKEDSEQAITRQARHDGLDVELREVPAEDTRYPVSGWVSSAVYLRLALAEAVPEASSVLYLDADVLVRRSLRPLLKTDLCGAPLAAVQDAQNPLIGRGIALPGWRELGLPEGRSYFNSGVMLLNLPACRSAGLFERARAFLRDHPDHVRFWDQDALNVAAADQWRRLERTWNTFALSPLASAPGFVHYAEDITPLATLLADETHARILHFAGPDKPWQPTYPCDWLGDLYRQHMPSPAHLVAP